LLQVTSVDSIAYQLYGLYWKEMDREKDAAEDMKRREEFAALDRSRFYL
jgi:hypothetical protein